MDCTGKRQSESSDCTDEEREVIGLGAGGVGTELPFLSTLLGVKRKVSRSSLQLAPTVGFKILSISI